jgi:hypothetical protein
MHQVTINLLHALEDSVMYQGYTQNISMIIDNKLGGVDHQEILDDLHTILDNNDPLP